MKDEKGLQEIMSAADKQSKRLVSLAESIKEVAGAKLELSKENAALQKRVEELEARLKINDEALQLSYEGNVKIDNARQYLEDKVEALQAQIAAAIQRFPDHWEFLWNELHDEDGVDIYCGGKSDKLRDDILSFIKDILSPADKPAKPEREEEDDVCGLCGKPGADKVPHPKYWPNEKMPGTIYVHAACELEEQSRAFHALSQEEIEAYLRTIR